MKKFITLLLFFASFFTLSAQVPQAICYQAVATDTRGNELVSQSIKVRLSVLKGSSAGAEEWVETHSVTTDGFGLFDLMIGSGTRISGSQSLFSGIKWGSDKYYLKVEMDVTGGTNYVLMGTNQMVSVPYSLYADKAYSATYADTAKYAFRAGIADSAARASRAYYANYTDSSRISLTAITANTAITALTSHRTDTANYAITSLTSRRADTAIYAITSLTSRRADTAIYAISALTARRADTATFAWLADSSRHAHTSVNAINAINAQFAINAQTALSARHSDTATFAWLADSSRRANTAITAQTAISAQTARRSDTATFAWLADSSRRAALAIRATIADSAKKAALAVKATTADSSGKAAVADNAVFATSSGTAQTALDDRDRDPMNEVQSMTYDTVTSTLKLSKPNGQYDQVSFSTTPLRAAGASIDYPFGILGEALLITSNYTVPIGKTLFISAVNNPIEMADGKMLNIEPGMPIIPTGRTIRSCFCSGILIDNQKYAEPLILDFSESIFEYEVPTGKYLVIKSGTNGSRNMSFVIDGTNFDFFTGSTTSPRLVVIPSGKKIRKGLTNVGSFIITGYLLQK